MRTAVRAAPPSRRHRPSQRRLRPLLPLATPAVVAFRQYARFTSIYPDENRRRFYLLTWQASLLGGGLLVRTWGRMGTAGTSRVAAFPDRDSASTMVERLVRRRLQRRYELVAWT